MKQATTKSYALRIDGPLVKPLQELKKQNRRSLNAEINAALEAWVANAQRQTAAAEAAPKPSRARKQAKRRSADVAGAVHTDTNSKADSSPDTAVEPDA